MLTIDYDNINLGIYEYLLVTFHCNYISLIVTVDSITFVVYLYIYLDFKKYYKSLMMITNQLGTRNQYIFMREYKRKV